MLRLDLGRLGREGFVQVDARVPADAPMWEESGLEWAGPVEIRLTASYAGTGEVVTRGVLEGTLKQECRRCLEPVRSTVEHDVTLVFVSSDAPGAEDDPGVYVYRPGPQLDLSQAVSEEVILAIDRYVVCDPDCQGLCPRCGINRNTGACSCTEEETDPRWEALGALKKK